MARTHPRTDLSSGFGVRGSGHSTSNLQRRAGLRRVAIGADHGGFELKAKLIAFLRAKGVEVADLGTHSLKPCDYPLMGYKVAAAVAEGQFDRGVLLCKSGIGIAIAANKVPGIRAAVCGDRFDAERSRQHNDANVAVLGAEKLSESQAKRILDVWLSTPFESGGRHERRVRQIAAIEKDIVLQQCQKSARPGHRERRAGEVRGGRSEAKRRK